MSLRRRPSSDPAPPRIAAFPDPGAATDQSVRWTGASLIDDQVRALAVGAWYADSWAAFHDTLALLPERPAEGATRRETAIDVLNTMWGITSHDEALASVRQLHAGMHGPLYALIHPLVLQAVETPKAWGPSDIVEQHRDFLRVIASVRGYGNVDAIARDYEFWLQAVKLGVTRSLPQPLTTDIVAWDLARAVFVIRASFTAGYIAEDVAWKYLMDGLDIAQRHYRSWRQLAQAYLTGALFWNSQADLSQAAQEMRSRHSSVLRLFERPTSPWRRLPLHPDTPVFGFSAFH